MGQLTSVRDPPAQGQVRLHVAYSTCHWEQVNHKGASPSKGKWSLWDAKYSLFKCTQDVQDVERNSDAT